MGMGGAAEAFAYTLFFMLALAYLAFLVAFFSRKAARVVAGLAIPIVALNMCGGVQMNMGDMSSLLRPSLWTGLILLALILMAIAVIAPLRIQNRSNGPNIALFFIAFLIGAMPVGYGMWSWSVTAQADRKARALVAGDTKIVIRKMVIQFGMRRAVITDQAMLRYLEDRLRKNDKSRLGNMACLIRISFEGGGEDAFNTYWSETGDFTFYIGMPGEGGDAYGVRLERPRPRPFDDLLEFLLGDNDETRGTVMDFEDGNTRLR